MSALLGLNMFEKLDVFGISLSIVLIAEDISSMLMLGLDFIAVR